MGQSEWSNAEGDGAQSLADLMPRWVRMLGRLSRRRRLYDAVDALFLDIAAGGCDAGVRGVMARRRPYRIVVFVEPSAHVVLPDRVAGFPVVSKEIGS